MSVFYVVFSLELGLVLVKSNQDIWLVAVIPTLLHRPSTAWFSTSFSNQPLLLQLLQ